MKSAAAIAELDALGTDTDYGSDSEAFHMRADAILLEYLKQTHNGLIVAEAWERARKRIHFWYS